MPIKGQSPKEVVHTEMSKFKKGTLHSGSKKGPKVTDRKQAVAIALSESGQAKPKGAVDRSSHYPGNPGFPSSSEAGGSPPSATYATHESREREVMGAGYKQHEAASRPNTPHTFPRATGGDCFSCGQVKDGHLRNSGHKGAHRIGKR